LVTESLRERTVLRRIAAPFVRPVSIMLPVYRSKHSRPPWMVHLGLGLYDLLAAGQSIRPHRLLSVRRALALEPGLRADGLRAAGLYTDCQMDDARLCLANVLQAVRLGAVCLNYMRVQRLLTTGPRVCGAQAEDRLSGAMYDITAKAVINATGPWADHIRRLRSPSAPDKIAATKGIHLIVPKIGQEALFVQAAADRRMIFILPWGDYSLIGTTESAVHGHLETLSATADEVGYLLEAVNHVLSGAHLDEDDVVATFAGARPLLAHAGSANEASREHQFEVDEGGMISVMGGKFTTYRRMAEQAVDLAVKQHRLSAEKSISDSVELVEPLAPSALPDWLELTRSIDPDLLARLMVRYGAGVLPILRSIYAEPGLARPICPHHEDTEAELLYAMTHELACSVTDVLSRRTRIAWSSCQGLDALSTVNGLFRKYLGWSTKQIEEQADAYHQFLIRTLAFRRATIAPGLEQRIEPAAAPVEAMPGRSG
jgi:glycerol-3-phosphate dehydrogenase